MDKNTKRYIIISTYIIVLYLALSNIKIVTNGLSHVMAIISPVVMGICIAFILNILLRLIEDRWMKQLIIKIKWVDRNKRLISIILTYTLTIVMIVTVILFIIPQVIDSLKILINTLPGYGVALQDYVNTIYIKLGLSSESWNQLFGNWSQLTSSLSKFTANTVNVLFDFTTNLTSNVLNFLIGIVLSIYILFSKEKLIGIIAKLNTAYMGKNISRKLVDVANEVNETFSKFIGGQITESLILGLLCFVGMMILRIPYAPLISVLIAITSLIPVLGAYIEAVPAVFIIFMESPIKALIFIIFITILQQVEGNLIYPKVVGKAIGLDGFWVFLAIIIAGNMFGVIGMLIGVPLMAVIYSLVREDANKRVEEIQKQTQKD